MTRESLKELLRWTVVLSIAWGGYWGPANATLLAADRDDAEVDKLLSQLEFHAKAGIRVAAIDADGGVTELHLRQMNVADVDFTSVAKLHRLESVNLERSTITDRQLQAFKGLPALRRLNLYGTRITDKATGALGTLKALRWLNLGKTVITDKGLVPLAGCQSLTDLELRHCHLTDAGAAHLGKIQSLEWLRLDRTHLTDASIVTLRKLPNLRGITLRDTHVTSAGLSELASDQRFAWMKSPLSIAEEFVRRLERSDYRGVQMMESVGLQMPDRGQFRYTFHRLPALTATDLREHRIPFRVHFRWTNPAEGLDDEIYILFAVKQGAVSVQAMGILRPVDRAKQRDELFQLADSHSDSTSNDSLLKKDAFLRGEAAKAAISKHRPSWGEEQGPIQFGIALLSNQRHYSSGQRIPLAVFVRNVGEQTVTVEFIREFQWNAPHVEDANGVPSKLRRGLVADAPTLYREMLRPGQSMAFAHPGVGLGGDEQADIARYPFWAKPSRGGYQLSHSHLVRVEQGGQFVDYEMKTGAIDFVVK